MTPREWCLLQEGHADREELRNRQIAHWLSPLISSTAGQVISPAQLLGEETASPGSTEKTLEQAERKVAAMLKAQKRKAKKEKACQA